MKLVRYPTKNNSVAAVSSAAEMTNKVHASNVVAAAKMYRSKI